MCTYNGIVRWLRHRAHSLPQVMSHFWMGRVLRIKFHALTATYQMQVVSRSMLMTLNVAVFIVYQRRIRRQSLCIVYNAICSIQLLCALSKKSLAKFPRNGQILTSVFDYEFWCSHSYTTQSSLIRLKNELMFSLRWIVCVQNLFMHWFGVNKCWNMKVCRKQNWIERVPPIPFFINFGSFPWIC